MLNLPILKRWRKAHTVIVGFSYVVIAGNEGICKAPRQPSLVVVPGFFYTNTMGGSKWLQ